MWTVVGRDPGPDLADHPHRVIDRDREALAAGTHPEVHRRRGRDADDLPGPVDHGSAGVAGAHRRGELDEAGQLVGGSGQLVLGVHRPAEPGHRAHLAGQRSIGAHGITERHHGFAGDQRVRVTDDRRRQPPGSDQLNDRDITSTVVSDEVGRVRLASDRSGDPVGALNDVEVGQHLAAGVQHDAGPRADDALVVDSGVDTHHRGLDLRRRCDGIAGCGGHRRHGGDERDDRSQHDQQEAVRGKQAHTYQYWPRRRLLSTWALRSVLDCDAATGPLTPAQHGPFAGRTPILQRSVGVLIGVNWTSNLRLRIRLGRRDKILGGLLGNLRFLGGLGSLNFPGLLSGLLDALGVGALAAAPGFALPGLQRFRRRRRQFGDERQVERQRRRAARSRRQRRRCRTATGPAASRLSQISLMAVPMISAPASTCSDDRPGPQRQRQLRRAELGPAGPQQREHDGQRRQPDQRAGDDAQRRAQTCARCRPVNSSQRGSTKKK